MPVYLLHVCKPPVAILKQIEKVIAKVFWGSTVFNNKLHWSSWPLVCLPLAEGGLGIRRIVETNDSFSYKLWFRFRQQESLWSNYMAQKYCKAIFPDSIALKNTDSVIWKRFYRISSAAQSLWFWKIGMGKCFFWMDEWTAHGVLKDVDANLQIILPWY